MELIKEQRPIYSFSISGKDIADMIAEKIEELDPEIPLDALDDFRKQFYEQEIGQCYTKVFEF